MGFEAFLAFKKASIGLLKLALLVKIMALFNWSGRNFGAKYGAFSLYFGALVFRKSGHTVSEIFW